MSGPRLLVVMGVSGCGKSTVAAALAAALDARFLDGDDFHPEANIAKMRGGTPLSDADRWPWLDRLGQALAAGEGRAVAACSALRRAYRDRLRAAAGEPVRFLHLAAPEAVIAARLAARAGHFMPPALLASQFASLEPPGPDEDAVTLDVSGDPAAVLAAARTACG